MRNTFIHLSLLLASLYVAAPGAAAMDSAIQQQPEEVIVVGERRVMELRLAMWEAERVAYEVFNAVNDDRRFDISCSLRQISGTRLKRQLCQPEFEIQAMRKHGQGFLDSYRAMLDPIYQGGQRATEIDSAPLVSRPAASAIASQQESYRARMREAAERSPEFLEALIEYSEARQLYERATSTGDAE